MDLFNIYREVLKTCKAKQSRDTLTTNEVVSKISMMREILNPLETTFPSVNITNTSIINYLEKSLLSPS